MEGGAGSADGFRPARPRGPAGESVAMATVALKTRGPRTSAARGVVKLVAMVSEGLRVLVSQMAQFVFHVF